MLDVFIQLISCPSKCSKESLALLQASNSDIMNQNDNKVCSISFLNYLLGLSVIFRLEEDA